MADLDALLSAAHQRAQARPPADLDALLAQAHSRAQSPAAPTSTRASIPGAEEYDTTTLVEGEARRAEEAAAKRRSLRTPEGPNPTAGERALHYGTMGAAALADTVDLIWGGMFAPILSAAGETAERVQQSVNSTLGIGPKKTRKEVSEAAAAVRDSLNKKYGQPARDLLTSVGILPPGTSAAEEILGPIMQRVDEFGAKLEERSKGGVVKEDVTAAVNMLFGAAGVKGAKVGAKNYVDAQRAKYIFSEMAKGEAKLLADEAGGPLPPADEAVRPPRPPLSPADRAQARAAAQVDKEAARRRFAEDPEVTQQPLSQPEIEALVARLNAEMRANPPAPRQAPPELVGPVKPPYHEMPPRGAPSTLEGDWLTTQPRPRQTPAATSDATTVRLGSDDPTVRWNDAERAAASVRSAVPTGEAAPAAVRGSAQYREASKLFPGAALAAGGLGLLALAPDADERALLATAGVGAVALGGRRLTLEALRTMPDATPLRAILDQSGYTFSTLEKLPPNRFEFGVRSIRELLKRQEVTKLEREAFEGVLKDLPDDGTITAKELMVRLKQATGDFELGVRKTGEFADYGLDSIGRKTNEHYSGWRPEDITGAVPSRTTPGEWLVEAGPNGFIGTITASSAEGAVRAMRSRMFDQALAEPPVTRIYQSPLELDSGNHFSDPNYFAHTRSFEEGGVRHVVEVQSDLAQKAGKTLTPEEVQARTELLSRAEKELEGYKALRKEFSGPLGDARQARLGERLRADPRFAPDLRRGENNYAFMLNRAIRNLEVAVAEHTAALAQAAGAERLAPLFKHWYKRIIREEVADAQHSAARNAEMARQFREQRDSMPPGTPGRVAAEAELARYEGLATAPRVRFADADTVAKVEGWPDESAARANRLKLEEQRLTSIRAHLDLLETGKEQYKDQGKIAALKATEENQAQTVARLQAELSGPRFFPEHQSIYDRYAGDIAKFLKQLGAKHVVDDKGHGWWEIPLDESNKALPAGGVVGRPGSTRLQMGAASPEVMQAVALLGGGAALGAYLSQPHEKGKGALWGAATGAAILGLARAARSPASSIGAAARSAGGRLLDTFSLASREIRKNSEPIARRVTTHAAQELRAFHDNLKAATPFVEGLRKLPRATREAINEAWHNNDVAKLGQLVQTSGSLDMIRNLRQALQVRRQLEADLRANGRLKGAPLAALPNVIADVPGLMRAIEEQAQSSTLAKAVWELNRQALRETGEALSPFDLANFLGQQGAAAQQFRQYFASAGEALPLWIRAAARERERARFFGADLVRNRSGAINLTQSVGNVVRRELAAKKITLAQATELESLLNARYGPGERAPWGGIQTYKNIVYTALLSNPVAAAINLTDVAKSAAVHGVMPTVKALHAIAGKPKWSLADFGLVNHLSEEISGARGKPVEVFGRQISTARILEKSLNGFGIPGWRRISFSAADELGKLTHLNAISGKFERLARTPAGVAEITRRWGNYFEKDLPQLLNDLRAGQKTDLVGELIFREFSDMQPSSKLEMSKLALEHPNARLFYTLKSFMQREILTMVDRGIKEVMSGNPRRMYNGSAFLVRTAIALGLAGAGISFIRDLMLGKQADLDWGDVADNMFKAWGWSSYLTDLIRRGEKGDYLKAAVSFFLPPHALFEDILRRDPSAMRYVPQVGTFWYHWKMGGAEKADIAKMKREMRKEKEAEKAQMTDEELEALAERRAARKEKARQRDLKKLEDRNVGR